MARPLRVLHVSNVETENYYLNNLFTRTDPRDIRFYALTFGGRGGFTDSIERRGYPAYALDCMERSRYPKAASRLREIIRRERIDLVHTHLFEPTFVGLSVAKVCGKRVVVTRHHSDAVHTISNRVKRSAYLLAERWINHCADHIIAPSAMVRDVLLDREGVSPQKVSLIPYGQTTERFDVITPECIGCLRAELGMGEYLSIVCVSRLYKQKGHSYLFEAFSHLIHRGLNARLYLVGQGPYREPLEGLTRELDIADRVRFLGWRDDALTIIAAADIVVHPSLHEALPSAVIEALMLERPLVVSDVSGVRDMVGNNRHGIIVPPADAAALQRGLSEMIDDLPAARRRASRGRQFILEYMDAGRVARDYTACYRRVAPRAAA